MLSHEILNSEVARTRQEMRCYSKGGETLCIMHVEKTWNTTRSKAAKKVGQEWS